MTSAYFSNLSKDLESRDQEIFREKEAQITPVLLKKGQRIRGN